MLQYALSCNITFLGSRNPLSDQHMYAMEGVLSIQGCYKNVYVVTRAVDHPFSDQSVWDIDIIILDISVRNILCYRCVDCAHSIDADCVVFCVKWV